MKYNRPEIVILAEAVCGIQGQMTKAVVPSENFDYFEAPPAYEADE